MLLDVNWYYILYAANIRKDIGKEKKFVSFRQTSVIFSTSSETVHLFASQSDRELKRSKFRSLIV